MELSLRAKIVLWIYRKFGRIINLILRPMYRIYELVLWSQICCGPMPRHVAIIPDGNRRWARLHGYDLKYGHEAGYRRLKEVLEWLWELGIKVVTIYAMSYENCLRRPKEEREHLIKLLEEGVNDLMKDGEIDRRKIRVKFIGRLDMIPSKVVEKIRFLENYSSKYSTRYLNVAVCYGGRQEIVNAVRDIVRDVINGKIGINDIDEDLFRKYLWVSHLSKDGLEEPDLVIRTSGELRVSNFLLWQIAYSELYFCDVFWPEFRKIDLWRAIRSYQRRERRFGK